MKKQDAKNRKRSENLIPCRKGCGCMHYWRGCCYIDYLSVELPIEAMGTCPMLWFANEGRWPKRPSTPRAVRRKHAR